MHKLRKVNLLDYPGLEGSAAEFFAIAHLRRDILIHVCLLDSKQRLHGLKRKISGQEPDQFDLAFCCWKKTEELGDLPGEFIILAFCKEWCLPNVIYHESFHAGIYAARGTDCGEAWALARSYPGPLSRTDPSEPASWLIAQSIGSSGAVEELKPLFGLRDIYPDGPIRVDDTFRRTIITAAVDWLQNNSGLPVARPV